MKNESKRAESQGRLLENHGQKMAPGVDVEAISRIRTRTYSGLPTIPRWHTLDVDIANLSSLQMTLTVLGRTSAEIKDVGHETYHMTYTNDHQIPAVLEDPRLCLWRSARGVRTNLAFYGSKVGTKFGQIH